MTKQAGDPEEDRRATRRAILRRTALAWGAAFALAVASMATTAGFLAEHERALSSYAETAELHAAVSDVLQLLVDGETAQRGYALTGDPAFLAPYDESRSELPESWSELRRRLDAHGDEDVTLELGSAIEARADFTREIIELVQAGRAEEARQRIASGEGRRRTDRVRAIARELERGQERSLDAFEERLAVARTRAVAELLAGTALTIALGLGMLVRVRRDLHAMNAAARALEASELRLHTIADASADLICIHRLEDGVLTFASRASEALLGYSPAELVGTSTSVLVAGPDRDRVLGTVRALVTRGETPPPLTHRAVHRDGTLRWLETQVVPIFDEDEVVRRFHTASRDIGERVARDRELRERQAALAREAHELREKAQRDELTGLLNRRGLLELGAAMLATARETGRTAVVYFCDLDGLKQINDRLGHDEGDRAIADAAEILRSVARRTDLVARLGGDELVVMGVVHGAGEAEGFRARVAERAREHDARAGRRYRVSLSMGYATWSVGEPERSVEDLLGVADAAMYENKRRRATTTRSGASIVR